MKGIDIDLIIVFTVYFLASNESSPGFFAFCQGFLLDILSGGILGLFTLVYLLVYFVIRIASHPVDLLSPVGRASVVFIAVMVKELLLVVFFNILTLQSPFSADSIFQFFLSSVLTSVLSIFIFSFFQFSPAIEPPKGEL